MVRERLRSSAGYGGQQPELRKDSLSEVDESGHREAFAVQEMCVCRIAERSYNPDPGSKRRITLTLVPTRGGSGRGKCGRFGVWLRWVGTGGIDAVASGESWVQGLLSMAAKEGW